MKKSLGSFLFVFFILSLTVKASTYKWTEYVAKKDLYMGESTYVKYTCEFNDNGELFIIDFKPKSNEKYRLDLLKESEVLQNGKRINTYEFVFSPKVVGDLTLDLKATMKKTSLDSIVENTTNHYDDTKFDSIHSRDVVALNTIKFNVQERSQNIVGKFELKTVFSNLELKAYDPFHLKIVIEGEGNFNQIEAFHFDIDGVKVFQEEPLLELQLTKNGQKGRWSQKFAFVSERDFRIPSKTLDYFDLQLHKKQTLRFEPIDVKVSTKFTKEELLDEDELDDLKHLSESIFTYAPFVLFFVFGFILGKIRFASKVLSPRVEKLIFKVKESKSIEELAMILILEDEKKFAHLIKQIESKSFGSLSNAKKLVTKEIR